jgi:hypothetical protein
MNLQPPRPQNPTNRNAYRNIVMGAISKAYPGSQRNVTTRDSHAILEDLTSYMSTSWDVSDSNLIVGVSEVGD